MRPDRSPVGDCDAEGGVSLAESDPAPQVRLAAEASMSSSDDSDAQSVTVRERAQRFAETPLAATTLITKHKKPRFGGVRK